MNVYIQPFDNKETEKEKIDIEQIHFVAKSLWKIGTKIWHEII